VEKFCREMKKKVATLSPAAIDELKKYPWPGNVRELQNSMERTVILADGDTIHPRHLNLAMHSPKVADPPSPWASFDLSGSLAEVGRRAQAEVERRKIEQALKEHNGDRGLAADVLQISYKMLLMKIKEYRIPD
jgi:two-component system response regulator AtoC